MNPKLVFVNLSFLVYTIASESCQLSHVSYDQRLETGIFKTYKNNGLWSCARICQLTTGCYSFNIHKFTGICELASDTAASSPDKLVNIKNWMYSNISGWPKTLSKACSNVTCPPRHQCIYTTSGDTACIETECPPLPNVENSRMQSPSTTMEVGATFSYECERGFKLEGTNSITCKDDGSWSSHVKCIAKTCPIIWHKRLDSCYLFVRIYKTYTSAQEYCENLVPGGHLVEMEDIEENSYVTSLSIGHEPFIGGVRVSGQWEWLTSRSNFSFQNWNVDEPNGGNTETCLQLLSSKSGKWNDISCSRNLYFVCEVKAW